MYDLIKRCWFHWFTNKGNDFVWKSAKHHIQFNLTFGTKDWKDKKYFSYMIVVFKVHTLEFNTIITYINRLMVKKKCSKIMLPQIAFITVFLKASTKMSWFIVTTLRPLRHSNNIPWQQMKWCHHCNTQQHIHFHKWFYMSSIFNTIRMRITKK